MKTKNNNNDNENLRTSITNVKVKKENRHDLEKTTKIMKIRKQITVKDNITVKQIPTHEKNNHIRILSF